MIWYGERSPVIMAKDRPPKKAGLDRGAQGSTLNVRERLGLVGIGFCMNLFANILIGADSLLKLLTHRERFL